MRKKLRLIVLALILGLACSAGSNTGGNENILNNVNSPDNNTDLNNSSSGGDELGGLFSSGPELLDLTDPSLFSVAESANAEIEMLMAFDGQDGAGSAITGQMHLEGVVSNDLPGASIELNVEGDAAFDGATYMAIVDLPGTDYIYTSETGCMSFGNNEFDNPYDDFMQSAEFVGTVPKVESNVEVEGYQTDKYLLSIENIPPDSFDGNEMVELYDSFLYVAQDGGFIIRIELSWSGSNEALTGNESIIGNNAAVYGFIPISGSVEILPPSECNVSGKTETIVSKFPVLPDATGFSSLGENFIQYTTNTAIADIVSFYESEMTALGYQISNSMLLGETAMLQFTGNGEVVSVIAAKVEGSENYTVNVGGE